MSLEVFTIEHGNSNLSYVIKDKKTNKSAVIDPNFNAKKFAEILEKTHSQLERIFLTHSHDDHTNALEDLLSLYSADLPIHISQKELNYWERNDHNFFIHSKENKKNIVYLGETAIKILFTPGHTAGHICLLTSNKLFSGDTIFIYGCGHCRSKHKGSNPSELFDSLQMIKSLDNHIIVYPGHNYGNKTTTTLGEQKKGNPFLKFTEREKFIKYRLFEHNRSTPYTPIYE